MYNNLTRIQIDLVNEFAQASSQQVTHEHVRELIKKYGKKKEDLVLVREKFAVETLISAMLELYFPATRFCQAYEYNGKLYSTAKKVPGMENTDYLHTLNFTSDQWNALPRHSVWIDSGKKY